MGGVNSENIKENVHKLRKLLYDLDDTSNKIKTDFYHVFAYAKTENNKDHKYDDKTLGEVFDKFVLWEIEERLKIYNATTNHQINIEQSINDYMRYGYFYIDKELSTVNNNDDFIYDLLSTYIGCDAYDVIRFSGDSIEYMSHSRIGELALLTDSELFDTFVMNYYNTITNAYQWLDNQFDIKAIDHYIKYVNSTQEDNIEISIIKSITDYFYDKYADKFASINSKEEEKIWTILAKTNDNIAYFIGFQELSDEYSVKALIATRSMAKDATEEERKLKQVISNKIDLPMDYKNQDIIEAIKLHITKCEQYFLPQPKKPTIKLQFNPIWE